MVDVKMPEKCNKLACLMMLEEVEERSREDHLFD